MFATLAFLGALALQAATHPEWVGTVVTIITLLAGYPAITSAIVSLWKRIGSPNPRVAVYIAAFGVTVVSTLLDLPLPEFDASNPGLWLTAVALIGTTIAKTAQAEYDWLWSKLNLFGSPS